MFFFDFTMVSLRSSQTSTVFLPLVKIGDYTTLFCANAIISARMVSDFFTAWAAAYRRRPDSPQSQTVVGLSPRLALVGSTGLSPEPSLLTAVHDVLHVQAHEAVGASGCWLVANLWRVPLQNFSLNVCRQSDPCLFCPVLVFCCCGILFDKMYGDIVNVWPLSLSVPTVWSKLTKHLFVVIFIFISF